MEYLKRIVILSVAEGGKYNKNARGILSLEQTGVNLKCKLKTFSFEAQNNLVVAVKLGDKLLSPVNVLKEKAGDFEFSLNNSLKINGDISVLVCESDATPVLYGGRENEKTKILKLVGEVKNFGKFAFDAKKKEGPKKEAKRIVIEDAVPALLEVEIIEYESDKSLEPENRIKDDSDKFKIPNLENKKKEDFIELPTRETEVTISNINSAKKEYENLSIGDNMPTAETEIINVFPENFLGETAVAKDFFNYDEVEIENIIDKEMAKNLGDESASEEESPFFVLVEEQVEQMFKTYPPEKELNKLIENSRWARVDYDGEGMFYALGLIYNKENNVSFICYAVPAKSGQQAPNDIKEYCQWMPLEPENPKSDGYYVMYQDAKTGENINMDY